MTEKLFTGTLNHNQNKTKDAQMALSLLRQTRQKSGETIHNYAERILSLAEEEYNNQGGDAVERHLCRWSYK